MNFDDILQETRDRDLQSNNLSKLRDVKVEVELAVSAIAEQRDILKDYEIKIIFKKRDNNNEK